MKKANNSFDEIMEWVLSAETIALAGHTNPDGVPSVPVWHSAAHWKRQGSRCRSFWKNTRINIS